MKCDVCNVNTDHSEQELLTFDSVAENVHTRALITVLPTFKHGASGRRICAVHFDVNRVTFPQPEGSEPISWKLVAVVCHKGRTVNVGHYWVWRRTPGHSDGSKMFTCISDHQECGVESAEKFRELGVFTQAYMMIFERNE